MQYTLTKYLTADYLRENDFLKAFLDLVDEIIFCCSMESLDVLSNMSFESMDDNYFLAYQNFFLNGLSTYDVNKLDKLVLSEWFSLLHVRGELSDIDKLLKFGGSLKNKEKNIFELYHSSDVPNQTIDTTKDGLIYLITENNIDLDQDYLINQQIPAGYRIGMFRTPDPLVVKGGDAIYLGSKESDLNIHVDSGDSIDIHKTFIGDITFYRRRQFDQYYTFAQLYRSQYTINQLSKYHQKGYYFFGFDVEHDIQPIPPEPVSEDFGEWVEAYLTTNGEAETGTTTISSGNLQLYDANGSALYPDMSFVYKPNVNWFSSQLNYSVWAITNNGTLGSHCPSIRRNASYSFISSNQINISGSSTNKVYAKKVLIFRAKSPFGFFGTESTAYSSDIEGTIIQPNDSTDLWRCGSSSKAPYSSLGNKYLVAAFDNDGSRLDISKLSLIQNANYAAIYNSDSNAIKIAYVALAETDDTELYKGWFSGTTYQDNSHSQVINPQSSNGVYLDGNDGYMHVDGEKSFEIVKITKGDDEIHVSDSTYLYVNELGYLRLFNGESSELSVRNIWFRESH